MPGPIEAVIFDFGGVIVPGSPSGDAPDSPYAIIERRHGLPSGFLWKAVYIDNPGWLRLRVGDGSEVEWLGAAHEAVAGVAGVAVADAVMAALEENRPQGRRLAGRTPEFNPGMIPLLERLRQRYRVGLLSNAAPGLEDELRDHYRIDSLFHDIINSATVRLAKPDPRIYHLAAERIGVTIARCFFTDDLPHNIEAARKEGMTAHQFLGYEGLHAALREAGVATDG
ncbi:MAG: HAD family phosphatase [Chloroflexi bacterium]|nr:HAD family phosphatase [Chloroflexota bacterium]